MQRMTVEEIQAVGLEILRHIDSFCRSRNIRYFLDSGTLIGAARHKGFIPWDDDVDIRIPRSDYERFVVEFEDNPKYKLYSPVRNNSYLTYARVCEMEKTFFEQTSLWTKESPGVGVDVFPLDGAPDSLEEYNEISKRMNKAISRVFRLRSLNRYRRIFRKEMYGFLKDCGHWLMESVWRLNLEYFIKRGIQDVERLRARYKLGETNHCFTAMIRMTERGWWKTEWFSDVFYLDFCGEKFPVPVGYEERLAAEYGDWRVIPPESERGGHSSIQTMYWRDK